MSTTVEKISSNKVKLSFDIDAAKFDEAMGKAYIKVRGQVAIPGFRKGHAPRKMIENMYGEGVFYDEAFELIFDEVYGPAIDENKLEVVDRPQVDIQQIGTGKNLQFTCEVFVKPDVTLGEYKGVEVKKEHTLVTEDDVNAEIEKERNKQAAEVSVDDRAVAEGDTVNLDYSGSVDGVKFAGGTAEGQTLKIGSHTFIPGFEEQLEGQKAGDDVEVKVTFPETYFVDALKGKEAEFKVHINDVKRKQLPALDDAFAKSISQFDKMDDLKASVKQQMQLQAIQQAEEAYHEALVAQAVANAKVDIPHEMVDQRIDEIVEEISMNLESRDMKLADYLKNIGQTEEQLRKNYEKTAEEQVRQGLVLETIAEKEELDVTNQDLSMEVYSMAHQFNADPKDVMKIIKEEGRVNMLINSVLRKKAAAFIYGAAKKAEADKKEAEEAPAAEAAAPKTEEDFNAMTVKDLKAYAQEKGIAIESKAKKAEIIDTIMAAEKE